MSYIKDEIQDVIAKACIVFLKLRNTFKLHFIGSSHIRFEVFCGLSHSIRHYLLYYNTESRVFYIETTDNKFLIRDMYSVVEFTNFVNSGGEGII